MAGNLESWARIERTAIQEDIGNLRAGGRVLSPSGDDITTAILAKLSARLEGVNSVLDDIDNAHRT